MTDSTSSEPTKRDQEGEGETGADSRGQASTSSSPSAAAAGILSSANKLKDAVTKGADWTAGTARAVYGKGPSLANRARSDADRVGEDEAEPVLLTEEKEEEAASDSAAKDPVCVSEGATSTGDDANAPSSSSATGAGPIAAESLSSTAEGPPVSSEDLRKTVTLNLGPGCEFLVRDTTLAVLPPLAVTIYLTLRQWDVMTSEGLVTPLVSTSWVVLAFILGWERGHHRMGAILDTHVSQAQSRPHEDSLQDEKVVRDGQVEFVEEEGEHSHSIFDRMMNKFAEKTKLDIDVKFRSPTTRKVSSPRYPKVASFYSDLKQMPSKSKSFWRVNVDSSSELMERLLRSNKHYRRQKGLEGTTEASAEEDAQKSADSSEAVKPEKKESANLGSIDIDRVKTTKKRGNEVIEPAFRLRGVDIFMTDCPEEKIWELQALNDCGLRDRPTFIINVQKPWANFVIYFEMPEWVKDFDSSLVEDEDDPADKQLLKRFLKGDGAYRTERFSFLPCLVTGPLPIRMMVPPGEELTVLGSRLPMSWHVVHGGRNGEAPLLGLDIDVTSDKILRNGASLAKRYIGSMILDIAIVIEEDDAACCLGLWRFDKPDLSEFPTLPEKTLEEDVQRVSRIVHLSSAQLRAIEVSEG